MHETWRGLVAQSRAWGCLVTYLGLDGILLIVPVVGIIVPGYLAWSD